MKRCRRCGRSARHATWCPEVDVDEAWLSMRSSLCDPEDAFRAGYALALVHAGMRPAPGAVEEALVGMTSGELTRLAVKISRSPDDASAEASP
jgi:hypothetical protein